MIFTIVFASSFLSNFRIIVNVVTSITLPIIIFSSAFYKYAVNVLSVSWQMGLRFPAFSLGRKNYFWEYRQLYQRNEIWEGALSRIVLGQCVSPLGSLSRPLRSEAAVTVILDVSLPRCPRERHIKCSIKSELWRELVEKTQLLQLDRLFAHFFSWAFNGIKKSWQIRHSRDAEMHVSL